MVRDASPFERWTPLLCFGQGLGIPIEPIELLKGNRARWRPMVESLSQVSARLRVLAVYLPLLTDAAGVEASGELVIAVIRATFLLFVAGRLSAWG